jgi:hypothetical protein
MVQPLCGLALLAWAAMPAPAPAGVVDGVEVPEVSSLDPRGPQLVLNGAGVREFLAVDLYVAALYLAQPRRTVDRVLALDQQVRLRLQFLRAISRQQLVDEWVEIIERNQAPEALPALRDELDRSRGFFRDVRPGDIITLDYVPGQGGRASFNGTCVGENVTPAFFRAALSVWLGPRPTQASLKALLLGQREPARRGHDDLSSSHRQMMICAVRRNGGRLS